MIDSDVLPRIEAERVSLRWLTEKDVDSLFSMFSDPENSRKMSEQESA